ncbi:MAG TPA: 50S ribosomal protein L3 [Pirellulales bacterium]
MAIGLLGRKVGMTQIFDEAGIAIQVTVLETGPCHVLQLRTAERDGYEGVQLGFLDKPRRLASRAARGQVAKLDSARSKALVKAGKELLPKADCEPQRFVREFRGAPGEMAVGQNLTVDLFENVKAVNITSTSKGKGFQGAMKRHNFKGQRATHGVKKVHRHIGGTSGNTFPGRTFKGKKMAGQMGNVRTTMRNLKVVRVDKENNLLLVRGAVPGPNGGYVIVRQTNKL